MRMKCDNCGSEFCSEDELLHVFPHIPELTQRIAPGEEVPAGTCSNCGSLVHLSDQTELVCGICGDVVPETDLREHLREHNPNAEGMDWEDIRNVFRVAEDTEPEMSAREKVTAFRESRGFRVLSCPSCHTEGRMAQHDFVPGYAMIYGVYDDGTIEWEGETRMDWDMQRPSSNPAEYVCLACDSRFTGEQLGIGAAK